MVQLRIGVPLEGWEDSLKEHNFVTKYKAKKEAGEHS